MIYKIDIEFVDALFKNGFIETSFKEDLFRDKRRFKLSKIAK